MATSREKVMAQITDKYGVKCRTTEEWDGGKGGIWITDCGGKGDLPAFDYNATEYDFQELTYTMGVRNDVMKFLDKCGWFAEPYDPGTWMLYKK